MAYLFKGIPWLVAGAALYHLGRTLLEQKEQVVQVTVARRHAQDPTARHRRLYRLAIERLNSLN
ncbi:MAG TPA: hypothetical protein VFA18_19835 [Gemmataceae bacterium]|nr:hypothetical protein [Gemmataceae bacterium]